MSQTDYSPHIEPLEEKVSRWQALRRTIGSMGRMPKGESWHVDGPICDQALKWVDFMETADFPEAQIFTHGNDAIVFTWDGFNRRRCYLTITENHIAEPLIT